MATLNVRFFEILDQNGNQFPDLDIEALLDKVANLPDKEAYVQLARMELLGSTYSPQGAGRAPQCPMIVLDRISREVRMRIENQREYRPLTLEEGDTIAEPTHFGLFPRNVFGIMRQSGQAPGAASFRDFINTAELLEEEVTVRPLVDANAGRALADVGRLTRLDLELDSEMAANVVGQTQFLGNAFDIFRQRLSRVGIEIVIKMNAKGPEETSEKMFNEVRTIAHSGAFANAERANINYRRLEDGKADSDDFLSESVAQSVEVEVDQQDHGPSNPRGSEAIREAYEKRYEDIQSALNGGRDVGQGG